MKRRFGDRCTRHFLRCAGFKYRAASGGTKKATDPKLVDTHVDKLRLRLVFYATDETAVKLLGLAPWLGETEARRTGAIHRRR